MEKPGSPYGPPASAGPAGLAAKLLSFCEELRGEGVAVGTSEILDAFAALEQVPWGAQEDFRECLAATIAKSQEDRRVFELLFDRFFFRATEGAAVELGIAERGEHHEGVERLDIDQLREQIREAILAGNEAEMRDLARLAIAAFGRRPTNRSLRDFGEIAAVEAGGDVVAKVQERVVGLRLRVLDRAAEDGE